MDDNGYVFVSHKCADHVVVFEIVEELEARGVRCWVDQRDIPVGTHWPDVIPDAVAASVAVLWVKSAQSGDSKEVLEELRTADDYERVIIPIEVESMTRLAPRWSKFSRIQTVSLTDSSWAELIEKRLASIEGTVVASTPRVEDVSIPVVATPAEQSPVADSLAPDSQHAPFALLLNDGSLYQLDAVNGLGESLVEEGDPFATGDVGFVAVSADASVIATCNDAGEVDLWTLGAAEAMRGPVLPQVLPSHVGTPRLLAVDLPLGQAIRVVAIETTSAYSIMQRTDGTWSALRLLDGDQPIVSGASVGDDVLFVLANGSTVWASNRGKRPFSLPKITGVDAAVGADGRSYLAGWGTGADGSSTVEVVAWVESGWERVHRGPGGRAGLVRSMPNVVLQTLGASHTSVAVEDEARSVTILTLP